MPIDQNRLVDTFCRLVSIDAPSLDERAMADHLTAQLNSLGIQVREDDAGKKLGGTAGNLIATVPGSLPGAPLLFSAHMDTVEPSRGKRAQVHPDGRITSAGDTVLGADDAAALAVILEALTVLKVENIPHRTLELVFPVAEEPYTIGSHQLDATQLQAKEAYVLDMDGAIGTAALMAPSILYFKATIQGRASHAGMAPEAGIHAIAVAAQALTQLKQGHVDDLTTVNIGTIQGGLATNIVPETCTLEGEVRGFDHQLALDHLAEIVKIFQDCAAQAGATVDIHQEVRTVAYWEPEGSPVVRRFLRACEKTQIPPVLSKTFGGSDNNTFQQRGIHGIVLSSAMFMAHSTREYTTIPDLVHLAELTLALMTDPE
jgi:tripeptide aminopeptidase